MNMHEYYSFHVNNITLECLFRLIKSGKHKTGPSEFIAIQVLYPPNCIRNKSQMSTLCGTRMMVSLTQLKAQFANCSNNITVRQSKRNWNTCVYLESLIKSGKRCKHTSFQQAGVSEFIAKQVLAYPPNSYSKQEPRGQCVMAALSPPRPFRRLARLHFSRFPCYKDDGPSRS